MAVSSACSADKDPPPILNLAKGGAVGAGRALGLRSCVEGGELAGARTRASRARSPPARPAPWRQLSVGVGRPRGRRVPEPSILTFWVVSEEGGTGVDGRFL